MPVIPDRLIDPVQVGATNTLLYTVADKKRVRNIALLLVNPTGTNRTIEIWFVPSGGSAGDTNKIADGDTVTAHAQLSIAVAQSQVLKSGDTIVAKASAATAITCHISGTIIDGPDIRT